MLAKELLEQGAGQMSETPAAYCERLRQVPVGRRGVVVSSCRAAARVVSSRPPPPPPCSARVRGWHHQTSPSRLKSSDGLACRVSSPPSPLLRRGVSSRLPFSSLLASAAVITRRLFPQPPPVSCACPAAAAERVGRRTRDRRALQPAPAADLRLRGPRAVDTTACVFLDTFSVERAAPRPHSGRPV